MSLKAFHFFFIFTSIVLFIGVGFWSIADFRATENAASQWMAIGSFACSVALVAYGVYAVKKYKNYSYL